MKTCAGALLVLVCLFTQVDAQIPDRVPRVGFLHPRTQSDGSTQRDAFIRGLRELGWVDGKTLVIEYRWAEGNADRLPDLAAELARLKVDAILAGSTAVAVVAKNATRTIPIVMATGADPVGLGLVDSLAHPGGNVTGLAVSVELATVGKSVELLREVVPGLRRMAVLFNPSNPAHAIATRTAADAARAARVQLQLVGARGPEEFGRAFASVARERAEALLIVLDPFFGLHRARLLELAAKSGLPTMYGSREFPEAGGLMSYGANIPAQFRRAAVYVDKILKGAKPAELPVEQPSTFELVINRRMARALRLTIPPSLLARADHVIE